MPNKNSLLKKGTQTSQNSHDDPDMPMTQARMGKMVPNFVAETTQGEIDFHKWLGNSWGILFSHPAPFTPICTTEMGAMAAEYEVCVQYFLIATAATNTNVYFFLGIQEKKLQIARSFL